MSDSASGTGPSFGHRLHPTAGKVAAGVPAADLLPPVVPGFTVGRLLGRGGSASAWLVTDDDGGRFALKIAAAPLLPAAGSEPTPGSSAGHGAAATPRSGSTSGPSSHGRRAARPDPGGGPVEQDAGTHEQDGSPARAGTQAPRARATPGGLERELRLLQRFRHEHLLRVHRMVETDQGPGMLAELAPGGSLLGLITSRGPLPISEVVTALAPIAQALTYLHSEGVAHGDVTPGNILFTSEGKPLLGDLGTGRLLGAGMNTPMGTPGFTDPLTDGEYDVGVDVFALAAVCWFALTGRAPGPTEQRPPLALIVPEVTPALMEIIEDGLNEAADRRPAPDDLARVLLASATPTPVNLVPAVHASILPELLTQHVADRGAADGGRRRWSARQGSGRSGAQPASRRSSRKPTSRTIGEGHRVRGVVAVAGATSAAVLLGIGVALAVDGRERPPAPDVENAGGVAADPRSTDIPPGAGKPDAEEDAGTADAGDKDAGTIAEGTAPPGAVLQDGRAAAEASGTGNYAGDPAAAADDAIALAQDSDPVLALEGLAALRAQAFTEADIELLQGIDVGGSPAMAADLDAVGTLADSGRTLDDLSIAVRDPSVLSAAEIDESPMGDLPAVAAPPERTDVALVRATAALSSYTEASGASSQDPAPAPLMAAGLQELVFVLWDSGTGWRIHTVALAPP